MNIIYFSGSGNTEYCASLFSEFTGGKMCSIEDKEEAREIIKLSETFAIAYPIHYSNMPFIVKDFIKDEIVACDMTRSDTYEEQLFSMKEL